MTYGVPTEPGWYWIASTMYHDRVFPVHVVLSSRQPGVLRYSSSFTESEDSLKPVSDAPDHVVWGPRIPEPKFSVNPQWEEP